MKYKKWRDLVLDPQTVSFQTIKLCRILNYMPAGNDVIEAEVLCQDEKKNVFIKFERSKMADFQAEETVLLTLWQEGFYEKCPKLLEAGVASGHRYLVLEKKKGKRLSELFALSTTGKREALLAYGKELALIHKIPPTFPLSFQRPINQCFEATEPMDRVLKEQALWLKEHQPDMRYDTFIHGDFHYGNVLFQQRKVSGILDWEYSGRGFKEQDIAWALVLRPNQTFLDEEEDLLLFLEGYRTVGDYEEENLRWCLVNAICHFYAMNQENKEFTFKLERLLKIVRNTSLR